MPGISNRIQAMPSSPIRKLVPYADNAKKRGVKVFHLNIGQPDIETPAAWWQAIQDANINVLAYSNSAGTEELRNKIIGYYGRIGHEITHDNLIVTTGASEALSFIFTACLNPHDEVIIPEPFYANYNGFSIATDVAITPITTSIQEGFELPPIEEFEKLINPHTKAILICNPGNPTGVVYSKESLEKLQEIVLKHDLYLIVDEVYREFIYEGEGHYSSLNLKGAEKNVIVVDSVSKRFSACGARIGCVISRNEEVMQNILKLAQARLSPPTLGQIGAAAVYDLPQNFYDEVVDRYKKRRDFTLAALNKIEGVFSPQVNGAFYVMAKLPIDDSEKFCKWMLESFEYEGATTMMAPGSGFYASPGIGKDEVRIAYVLKRDDLAKAMKCLEEGLKAYPGRTHSQVEMSACN